MLLAAGILAFGRINPQIRRTRVENDLEFLRSNGYRASELRVLEVVQVHLSLLTFFFLWSVVLVELDISGVLLPEVGLLSAEEIVELLGLNLG